LYAGEPSAEVINRQAGQRRARAPIPGGTTHADDPGRRFGQVAIGIVLSRPGGVIDRRKSRLRDGEVRLRIWVIRQIRPRHVQEAFASDLPVIDLHMSYAARDDHIGGEHLPHHAAGKAVDLRLEGEIDEQLDVIICQHEETVGARAKHRVTGEAGAPVLRIELQFCVLIPGFGEPVPQLKPSAASWRVAAG